MASAANTDEMTIQPIPSRLGQSPEVFGGHTEVDLSPHQPRESEEPLLPLEQRAVLDALREVLPALEADRETIRKELRETRRAVRTERRDHAKHAAHLAKHFQAVLTDRERNLKRAQRDIEQLRARIAQLGKERDAALAANRRVNERVKRVEQSVHDTLVPLREELETSRQRQAYLERELARVRKGSERRKTEVANEG